MSNKNAVNANAPVAKQLECKAATTNKNSRYRPIVRAWGHLRIDFWLARWPNDIKVLAS